MKALILAAGLGTRLAPITNSVPKCLVKVNNKPIIFKQIENLLENGIKDISVVSGYKSDILIEELKCMWPFVNVIVSKDYATTNNMYSAYIGLNSIFPKKLFSDLLMMNADVFFDSSVISSLIDFPGKDAIVVDVSNYMEESMKVEVNEGRVTAISKQVPRNKAYGCSIDVYKFSSSGISSFYSNCVSYIEKQGVLDLWSEVALNDSLSDHEFQVCPLKGRWFEIDNHDDLSKAELIFKTL